MVCRAANWVAVGLTKGYLRSNGKYGKYIDKHGVKKMLVYPLKADVRTPLRDPGDREEWGCEGVDARYGKAELRHPLWAVLPCCCWRSWRARRVSEVPIVWWTGEIEQKRRQSSTRGSAVSEAARLTVQQTI